MITESLGDVICGNSNSRTGRREDSAERLEGRAILRRKNEDKEISWEPTCIYIYMPPALGQSGGKRRKNKKQKQNKNRSSSANGRDVHQRCRPLTQSWTLACWATVGGWGVGGGRGSGGGGGVQDGAKGLLCYCLVQ